MRETQPQLEQPPHHLCWEGKLPRVPSARLKSGRTEFSQVADGLWLLLAAGGNNEVILEAGQLK